MNRVFIYYQDALGDSHLTTSLSLESARHLYKKLRKKYSLVFVFSDVSEFFEYLMEVS